MQDRSVLLKKRRVRVNMDIFNNSNWYLTKCLLSSFGAWPFQTSRYRYVLRFVVGLLICSILIPEIMRIFTVKGNITILVECVSTLLLHLLTAVKMINCFVNFKREKQLLTMIRKDWETHLSPSDAGTLQYYENQNRVITHGYIYYIYATTVMYMGTPMVPKILDHFLPLNESRPTIFLYEAEYLVDRVAYKDWILLHSYIITPFPATIVVAFDSLYANFADHACCIFLLTSHRMENLAVAMQSQCNKYAQCHDYNSNASFMDCIKHHIKALRYIILKFIPLRVHQFFFQCLHSHVEYQAFAITLKLIVIITLFNFKIVLHQITNRFAHLLRTTYSKALFFILGINMLAISITGCQTVMKLDEPSEALRFGTYTIGQLIHLYFLSWPGQKLMDHSEYIHTAAYQGNWYNVPSRLQKLLIVVMLRSSEACKLTAGGVYVMSLRSFSLVLKTSVSYFTVLISFQ